MNGLIPMKLMLHQNETKNKKCDTEDVLFVFVLGLFCFASALLIFSTILNKV